MNADIEMSPPEDWAIVELMGHLTRVGRVSTVERYGARLMRLDIPAGDGFVSEEIGGSAIYRVRYVTEDVARAQAARMPDPRPVAPAAFQTRLPYDGRDQEDGHDAF